MRTIIAGGRDYSFTVEDIAFLDTLNISTVISGCARGADREGEMFAKVRGIPIEQYPADWALHGKSAGPKRNRKMAAKADAVVLFPGGAGTDSMCREAMTLRLKIHDRRML